MACRPASGRCTLPAPAKLNLCLELLGKREDGFHELRTLFATIRLRDTVTVRSTPAEHGAGGLTLEVAGDPRLTQGVPADGRNLVIRALERLREAAGVAAGAAVRLVKRVPNQAGLGGGSSDAAAALVAGARVWGVDWSAQRLARLGAELGSDVPFFVHAHGSEAVRFAVGRGRGEQIEPIAAPGGVPAVVVKPDAGLSTAEVYASCRPEDHTPLEGNNATRATVAAALAGRLTHSETPLTNALSRAALRVAPTLRRVDAAFAEAGCRLRQLSGSGSAYFGLARSMAEARRLAARLRALRFGQVFVTSIG